MEKTRAMVQVKLLRDAPHNPPNRILPKNIASLADSMDVLGLLQPITIGLGNQVIEGHRRVAAAKLLGWKEIEANIVKDCDENAIYGSINNTSRKLSGSDSLYVWLITPQAVVPSQRKLFERMTEILGRPLVKKVSHAGHSYRIFRNAEQIAKYCEKDNPETIQSIVEWLLKFPVTGSVMKAVSEGQSPRTILSAVQGNKPVKFKLAVG